MRIEVKQEGTLVFLYLDGKAVECYLMHELSERVALLLKASNKVKEWHEQECAQRSIMRQAPVTFDSYVRHMAGPNVRKYMLFDGSETHPIMWPELVS